ncbi:hypothetical protein K443DRAFT_401730 [Laccaria amethystina LaAM-08-1]|uniref:Unplaced genomic scaffold K443scaffold_311, whole genome shotgun sequence n=1 Tax=Laccaria amethystina LaAM-08-1 TaxID=1095629 RepID=A0A0C9WX44_9AGAR|nr:hypothetical protein K443DRAFT_401730 [Laccaria amethystina LaAM-08-1]
MSAQNAPRSSLTSTQAIIDHRRPNNGCSPPILPLQTPHPHSPPTLRSVPRSWTKKVRKEVGKEAIVDKWDK